MRALDLCDLMRAKEFLEGGYFAFAGFHDDLDSKIVL